MIKLKAVTENDIGFWFSVDGNISADNLRNRIAQKTGFIICMDDKPVGVITYNMFWDELPFLSLIKIIPKFQRHGVGRAALNEFGQFLRDKGYTSLLTSTQTDESAQNFYRKTGFRECGCLVFNAGNFRQPMEMFFIKDI